MRFACTIKQLLDGDWLARCVGDLVGVVEVLASHRQATLDQLLSEVRYRLEWCPCSHLNDEEVVLDVTELRDPIPMPR
jgi:hypothetical protein